MSTRAPTPPTISVISHDSVSSRNVRSSPSTGIHSTFSTGPFPACTRDVQRQRPHGGGGGCERQDPERLAAHPADQHGRDDGCGQVNGEQQQHVRLRPVGRVVGRSGSSGSRDQAQVRARVGSHGKAPPRCTEIWSRLYQPISHTSSHEAGRRTSGMSRRRRECVSRTDLLGSAHLHRRARSPLPAQLVCCNRRVRLQVTSSAGGGEMAEPTISGAGDAFCGCGRPARLAWRRGCAAGGVPGDRRRRDRRRGRRSSRAVRARSCGPCGSVGRPAGGGRPWVLGWRR